MLNGPFARSARYSRQQTFISGICVQAKAAISAIPQKPQREAALAWGGKHQKDEGGRGEMLQLSKPRKPSKNDYDDRWELF